MTETGYADTTGAIESMTADVETVTETESGGDDAARAEGLDADVIHHLLQNKRRRNVLRYLRGVEGPVQMRDVAEQVSAWEHDTTVTQLMSDQRQRVYIALYQSHLPKFDEEGIIDYNQSRGIVEKRPAAEELMTYLDREPEDDEETEDTAPWDLYYLGASGASTIALVLASAGVGLAPLSGVSPFLVATLVVTVFTALTVARIVSDDE